MNKLVKPRPVFHLSPAYAFKHFNNSIAKKAVLDFWWLYNLSIFSALALAEILPKLCWINLLPILFMTLVVKNKLLLKIHETLKSMKTQTKSTFINLIILLVLFLYIKPDSLYGQSFDFKLKQGEIITLKEHPRLFFSKDEEKEVLYRAANEPLLANLITVLRNQADELLTQPLQKPTGSGTANLRISREQVYRMITLSLAYRLFKEDAYAERVEKELLNVTNFESWNPKHFLDVAEMTTAVAIGYDWCFDNLSDEAKNAVENAIHEKAFTPAWQVYENGDEGSWAKRNTNWNVVCHTGLVTGALAIADKYPEDAANIIQYAVQFTPNNIQHFAPNGVYYEGPAYWAYTNMYLSLLLDNFQRVLGTDFGLSDMEGVNKTAQYYIETLSPAKRVFNFADAHDLKADLSPIYFFFSKKFDQPEVADFYRSYLEEILNENTTREAVNFPRFFFLAIPWFDHAKANRNESTPMLQVFEGEPDILVFNGDKNMKDELFLIAKGGDPDMAHNQLDVGTFVVESQGIRWGIDLGSEKYGLANFWDYKPDGGRWEYFRNNNLSHNTINIDGEISHSGGNGELSRYHLAGQQPFGVLDMTSSYKDQADSVMRGFKMISPDVILVRDEVKLKPGSDNVAWRFFTEANININGNVVELEQKGKKFYLKISPQETNRVHVMDAKPQSMDENQNEGVKMIEVSASATTDNIVTINVLMGSDINEIENMSGNSNFPIASW